MRTDRSALPAEIRQLLDGDGLASKTALVFELLTVAQSGWPHIALLSVGEVVALNEETIGLALWPGSSTTENLRRSGIGVLQLYHAGAAFRIRLTAQPIGDPATDKQALFAATVRDVVRDAVGYARLVSGPTIELADAERVLTRWLAQVELIRKTVTTGRRPGEA